MKIYVVMLLRDVTDGGMIVGDYTEAIDAFDNMNAATQLKDYINARVGKKGYAFIDEFDLESTFDETNYSKFY